MIHMRSGQVAVRLPFSQHGQSADHPRQMSGVEGYVAVRVTLAPTATYRSKTSAPNSDFHHYNPQVCRTLHCLEHYPASCNGIRHRGQSADHPRQMSDVEGYVAVRDTLAPTATCRSRTSAPNSDFHHYNPQVCRTLHCLEHYPASCNGIRHRGQSADHPRQMSDVEGLSSRTGPHAQSFPFGS